MSGGAIVRWSGSRPPDEPDPPGSQRGADRVITGTYKPPEVRQQWRVEIIAYLNQGLGNRQIASLVGCSERTVYRVRKERETA